MGRDPEPDLDERFTLHPEDPEDVLRRLLGAEEPEETETEVEPEP